jgi:acetylornithine/N-succinyldiaminopimelate aminotransferase
MEGNPRDAAADKVLEAVIASDAQHYMKTFGTRIPVCVERGEGAYLFDTADRRYLDMIGGIAVSVLGHGNPRLVSAIAEQAARVIHCSNLYYNRNQTRLAERLTEISFADRVFFANSGAEANEGAIKLARGYFHKLGAPRAKIVSMKHSFHGRTLATATATGTEKYSAPFRPLPPGFVHVEFNDVAALEAEVDGDTCAVLVELIQGESGVRPATQAFVDAAVAACRRTGALLAVDEVQTGMGRTGRMFAYEHYGIEPDIVTIAKGLGGGVPIGAVLAREEAAKGFAPGDHGSTFGGGPLACAAALAVLDEIEEKGLVAQAAYIGAFLMERLAHVAASTGAIDEVRGMGLMIGIGIAGEKAVAVRDRLLAHGVLANSVGTSTIRILPPLILTEAQAGDFCDALESALTEV